VTELAPPIDPLLRLHGDQIARGAALDLAVNVAAGGAPAWLLARIAAALETVGAYPDERAAVAAVAARHCREPDEVVLLNGAAQAFWLLAHALSPRHAVCVHPSFTEPEVALRAAGHRVDRLLLPPPYGLDPTAVPAAADLVVLGSPTNPTGVLHPRAAVAALCRPGRMTVVDEAFMDFVPGEPETLAGASELPGLVVVRSLTKMYALPGLRAGYLLAPAPLARRLREHRPGWSVNALALAATEACAADRHHATTIATATATARADLAARLAAHPRLAVSPGARANFLLVEGPPRLAEHLATSGIAVRPCASFPGLGPRHVRITVRDAAAHAVLAEALP
jgi:histidinol-phosphate aminotransferase